MARANALAGLDDPVEGVPVGDGQPETGGVGAARPDVALDRPQGVRTQSRVRVHDQQPGCLEKAGAGVHLACASGAASHDLGPTPARRIHGSVPRSPVDDQHLVHEVELREIPEQVGKGVGLVESRDDDPEFGCVHGRRQADDPYPEVSFSVQSYSMNSRPVFGSSRAAVSDPEV